MIFQFKNKLAIVGTAIIVLLLFTAFAADFIAPFDPRIIDLEGSFRVSSPGHIFGQDQNGADILSKIIYGAQTSLFVGFFTVFVSLVIGTFLGTIAGYFRGAFDQIIMRMVDIFMAFPGLLLAIAISALMEPSIYNVVFALSFSGWVSYARIIRSQVLSIKEFDHVLAARSLGAGRRRIIFYHILPNAIGPLTVAATFGIAGAIIGEASLSFLGIGAPPTVPSWGAMLDQGRQHLLDAPHLATYPGIAIMLAVLGFNFLGDALRDRFDPKSQV